MRKFFLTKMHLRARLWADLLGKISACANLLWPLGREGWSCFRGRE